MTAVFRTVRSRLAPAVVSFFTVPHPFLPYIASGKPVYFDSKGEITLPVSMCPMKGISGDGTAKPFP